MLNYFKKKHLTQGAAFHPDFRKVTEIPSEFETDLTKAKDKLLSQLPNLLVKKNKKFRVDLQLYEQKFTLVNCISFYVYSIWNGKLKFKIRLLKIHRNKSILYGKL